jgi:hypothetical protein
LKEFKAFLVFKLISISWASSSATEEQYSPEIETKKHPLLKMSKTSVGYVCKSTIW